MLNTILTSPPTWCDEQQDEQQGRCPQFSRSPHSLQLRGDRMVHVFCGCWCRTANLVGAGGLVGEATVPSPGDGSGGGGEGVAEGVEKCSRASEFSRQKPFDLRRSRVDTQWRLSAETFIAPGRASGGLARTRENLRSHGVQDVVV